jgi:hypothetical protein
VPEDGERQGLHGPPETLVSALWMLVPCLSILCSTTSARASGTGANHGRPGQGARAVGAIERYDAEGAPGRLCGVPDRRSGCVLAADQGDTVPCYAVMPLVQWSLRSRLRRGSSRRWLAAARGPHRGDHGQSWPGALRCSSGRERIVP